MPSTASRSADGRCVLKVCARRRVRARPMALVKLLARTSCRAARGRPGRGRDDADCACGSTGRKLALATALEKVCATAFTLSHFRPETGFHFPEKCSKPGCFGTGASRHDRSDHRRQGNRAELRGKVMDTAHRLARDRNLVPGPRWCWSASTRRARSMSPAKPRRPSAAACARSITACRDDRRGRAAGAHPPAPIRWCTASCCNCRCPRILMRRRSSPRSTRPRTSTACIRQYRSPAGRRAGAGALYAAWLRHSGKVDPPVPRRARGGGHQPLNLVGKPLAHLLAENATVTIAHSKTADLPAVGRQRISYLRRPARRWCGRAGLPGATVIDVGVSG